ncbi:MAG: hypothetical protein KC464_18570 [Myxococcales bacterium]|nr:hypothetical protein [Myxococcales bacterium]
MEWGHNDDPLLALCDIEHLQARATALGIIVRLGLSNDEAVNGELARIALRDAIGTWRGLFRRRKM